MPASYSFIYLLSYNIIKIAKYVIKLVSHNYLLSYNIIYQKQNIQ